MIGARWVVRQQTNSLYQNGFPDEDFLDHQPYWGEYKNRTRGGTNPKHQREKELRRQRAEAGESREKEVSACYSPPVPVPGLPTRRPPLEKLRLVTGMVRPAMPCGGVALSAALTYEDAVAEGRGQQTEYWTYQRVMEKSFSGGRSIIKYHTLPFMRADRLPAGWDKWGRPWALMDFAQELVPHDGKVWRCAHTPGRVLVAVLVRYDEEPYYFPDAPALLQALHQNVKTEGDIAAQPGAQGWSARELKQVEILLWPHTYPPCGAVTSCLRKWTQFAHRGDGYREGPAMPGGPDQVAFHTECWDHPEPIEPPGSRGPQVPEE